MEHDLSNIFIRVDLKNTEINARSNVIITTKPSSDENKINFLIDIDVYKQDDNIKCDIWQEFEDLRIFKNEIFFKLISQKTIELYT